MKILLDATCVEDRYCGYRIYAEGLLRELLPLLRAAGHEVTLLARADLRVDSPLLKLAEEHGLATVTCGVPVLGVRRLLASLFRQVPPRAAFDLYFCLHSNPLPAPPARRRVAVLHDLTTLRLPGYFRRLGFLKRLWLRFEYRFLLRRMDRIVAVSASTRNDACALLGIPAGRITVVLEAGQRLPEAAPAPDAALAGGPFFLTFGSRPHKNIARTVEAFCGFAGTEAGRGWRLAVVGSCRAEKERLRGQFPEEVLARVVEVPSTTPAVLAALYRDCAALLYVPLYEGFGLPLAEAMAAGKPAVTSTTSSMPEVAGDAALLVNPYDTGAIRDAVAALAADGTRAALAVKAVARAKLFSWRKTAGEILHVLEAAD